MLFIESIDGLRACGRLDAGAEGRAWSGWRRRYWGCQREQFALIVFSDGEYDRIRDE